MVRGRLYSESPIHRLVRDGIKGSRDVDEGDTKIVPSLPSIPNDTVKSSGMFPAPVDVKNNTSSTLLSEVVILFCLLFCKKIYFFFFFFFFL